jgi:hypothetical protein
VEQGMQKLITHIAPGPNYEKIQHFLDSMPSQYLDPKLCNEKVSNWSPDSPAPDLPRSGVLRYLSLAVSTLVNFPPLLVNGFILSLIGDPVFNSSIKVISALILFPIYYLTLFILGSYFFSWYAGLAAVFMAILTMLWRKYSLVEP